MKTIRGPAGLLGAYPGFGLALACDIPYRAVYFGLYDSLREKTPFNNDPASFAGIVYKYAVAHLSATAAEFASYPFGRARHRLQWQEEQLEGVPREYGSTLLDCWRGIVKKEGYGGLFKGAALLPYRASTVGSAIVLLTYDLLRDCISGTR